MIDMEMIRDLTEAFGPSGFEEDVAKAIAKHCADMDFVNDAMNNVYVRLEGPVLEVLADGERWAGGCGGRAMKREQEAKRSEASQTAQDFSGKAHGSCGRRRPVIMLDAHTDECGFMVQGIMDNGLLSMILLGGMDLASLPAHTVSVRTRSGRKIRGIITSRPVHFMTEKDRSAPLDLESMFIDVGASNRREVQELGIHIGDPAAPEAAFEYDAERELCFGKAFDNRMGCACVLHTMRELKAMRQQGFEPMVDVVGAFAAQEEVGTRGAGVTAAQVQPDLAIVFEGSPADDFYYGKEKAQGALHGGTQIRCMDKSYITNPAFLDYAHELAEKLRIPCQDTVRRGGSTNAGKISLSGRAVPTLVLGIPSRYVHSHYNFCAKEDIESTVRLAVEAIKNLDGERLAHLMRQDLCESRM